MSANLLINSGVALNFQSATYELVRNLSPGVVHTFSMSGWHGGDDWDSNFGVYGVTDSGSEVLLGEASYMSVVSLYYVRFTPNAPYSYITVKSMKTHNNFNYQINWAYLNEGTDVYNSHSEPVLPDVRRLYYGQDEVMKRYVGTGLAHLVEWQRRIRFEAIPFSTSRYNDANRYIGEEVITQAGVNGWMEYVWTTEVVNGIKTGNKTSELVGRFQGPRQQQIAVGTKTRNLLKPGATGRAVFGGSNIIHYFEWIERPDPDKQYRITRYGPITAPYPTLLAVEPDRRIGNCNAGSISDGQSKIVWGRSFQYAFSGGDLSTSLGIALGTAFEPQSPSLQLIVEEV